MPVAASSGSSITGILLAAGSGTRLGLGPKALLHLGPRQLVSHLAGELLAGGCTEVVVVLGDGAERVRQDQLPYGCRLVVNPNWSGGLSTSFRCGIGAAANNLPVLLALVDQPGLHRGIVRRLIDEYGGGAHAAVAACYRAPDGSLRRGHPVILAPAAARESADLAGGDAGARAWLARHSSAVRTIDCGDLDDGLDVDTLDDLRRWRQGHPGVPLQ